MSDWLAEQLIRVDFSEGGATDLKNGTHIPEHVLSILWVTYGKISRGAKIHSQLARLA